MSIDASAFKRLPDTNCVLSDHLDSLSGLLPEPPSQPPPDAQGPPILSHNEVSQFNSHIEALTSAYTHTPNWKDPPKLTHQNSHGLATLPQLDPADQTVYLPHYHGIYPGGGSQYGSDHPQGTIAPQQLLHNDLPQIDNHNYMDLSGSNFFSSPPNGHLHPPINGQKSYFSTMPPQNVMETLVDQSGKSQNPMASPDMSDFTNSTVFSYLTGIPTQPNTTSQAPSVPSPIQARMQYGSDPSYTSQRFAPRENLITTERDFAYYGLEPEASAANTRRNSPDPETLDRQAMSPKFQRKRKSIVAESISSDVRPSIERNGSSKKLKLASGQQSTPVREKVRDIEDQTPTTPTVSTPGKPQRSKSASGTSKRGRKKSSPKANLTKDQRMANHRTSEQNRRNRTKKAKNRLWVLVPALKQKKKWAEKNQLDEANKHIRNVMAGNEALRKQLQQLQGS